MTIVGSSSETLGPSANELTDPRHIRAAVEKRLAALIAPQQDVPFQLQGAIQHALLGQSKRVRPVLLFLVAQPNAEDAETALDLGCALEMVHTASLILDDLPCMDDAQVRRQRPTTHLAFGQSTAILGAIALLTRAFGIIASLESIPAATRSRLTVLLSDAVGWYGLVAGQEIDVNSRATLKAAADIEHLNWLKTGVLFVAAAEMGAILRGLEDRQIEAVRRFARHFGLAFQTADDLIDQTASADEAGKDVAKDGGKATLVSLFGASQASLTCQHHLASAQQALSESGIAAAPIHALMTGLFQSRGATA